jgi:hypothetical protein
VIRETEQRSDLEMESLRRELESQQQAAVEDLRRAHSQQIDELRESHGREMESMTSALSENRLSLNELRLSHSQELESQRQELESHFQALLANSEQKHAELTSSLLVEHREEVSKLTKDIWNEKERVQTLQERLSSKEEESRKNLSVSLNDQLERLLAHHQKELDHLRNESSQAVAQLQQDVQMLSQTNKELSFEVAEERKQHALCQENEKKTLAQLTEMESKIEELKTASSSQSSALLLEYQDKMAHQQTSHQKVLDELTDSHAEALEILKSRMSEMQRGHEMKLQTLSEEAEMKLSSALTEQMKTLQLQHQQQLEEMESSLQLSHQQALETELQTVRESYENEMLRIKDIHTDEITSFQIQTNHTITELQQLVRVMKNDLHEKDNRVTSLSEAIAEHVTQHTNLELKIEQIQSEYQTRVEKMQRRYDEAVSGLNSKRSEEISSLKSFFESQNQLRSLQQECDRQIDSSEKLDLSQKIIETYKDQISHLHQTLRENSELSAREVTELQSTVAALQLQMQSMQRGSDELVAAQKDQLERKHQIETKSYVEKISALERDNLRLQERCKTNEQLLETEKQNWSKMESMRQQQLRTQLEEQREELQRNHFSLLHQEFEKIQKLLHSQHQVPPITKIEGFSCPSLLL